jgi:hypothetical protein
MMMITIIWFVACGMMVLTRHSKITRGLNGHLGSLVQQLCAMAAARPRFLVAAARHLLCFMKSI